MISGIPKTSAARSKWLAPALSAGFAAGATALGYGALAPAASYFGGYLGQKLKDITGYGDYVIRKNSLIGGTVPSLGNPSYVPNGLTISHKEYLGDVITSENAGNFAISGYILNPSNSQLWEFLAQIAMNYEQWVPEGIVFYFKTTSTNSLASTNTALGTIIMATNYNPYNQAFSTKAEMEAYEFCSNGIPSEDLMHAIECDPAQGSISIYTMSSYNQAGQTSLMDKRFQTLGTFYIATTGFQAASVNIGELWVTYQVTLLKPKLYQSLGYGTDTIYLYEQVAAQSSTYGLMPIVQGQYRMSHYTMPFTAETASTKLWVQNSSNQVDIHWPVYPFGVSYYVEAYFTIDSQNNRTFTLSHYSGAYPVIYAPTSIVNLLQTPAPGTSSTTASGFSFWVNVPGGFIPTNTNTPFTRVVVTSNISGTPGGKNWVIVQMPYQKAGIQFASAAAGNQ